VLIVFAKLRPQRGTPDVVRYKRTTMTHIRFFIVFMLFSRVR